MTTESESLGAAIRNELSILALPGHGVTDPGTALILYPQTPDLPPQEEATQREKDLRAFISSHEFASSVDRVVGDPREGESEEEYVQRAKDQIRELLLARFSK